MSAKSNIKSFKKFVKYSILYPSIYVSTNNRARLFLNVFIKKIFFNSSFLIKGNDSVISIESGTIIKNCRFRIVGNSNKISIGKNCRFENTTIDIYSEKSQISIGDNTSVYGNHMGFTHFLAKGFSTDVMIGKDCLFSYGIEVRTTDSHSIFDEDSGELLNPPKSIIISDHCWIGSRSLILKGTNVGSGSIVGAGSIVTKDVEAKTIVAGIPAKTIKTGINWSTTPPNVDAIGKV